MIKLSAKYDFKEVENKMYQTWVERNYFQATDFSKEPFTIIMPPPNVTGKLHLGHAWDNTLQDIIIRRKRMQGYNALFLPGMDHAGIATQAVVDEKLMNSGINRHDLTREEYLKHAWYWKEEYSGFIRKQWEALGLSVDYSKETFTLDPKVSNAVNKVFMQLYQRGYLYRGNRIINWDPKTKTALSNIEVNHRDEKAKLYYFKYPFVGSDNSLVIATTRPETMFADQAVMVHPDDSRYQNFIGEKVFIPGTLKQIPIIADDYVLMGFGTGAVKVTPAHDPNDFEVGQRHQLASELCMNEDGTMNHLALQYENQDRFECRRNLVDNLQKLGLVEKIEDYQTSIGYSERSGVVVEPRLSLQWFVKMDDLAKKALKTKVNFFPERFKKIYNNWLEDIQDWTISRQLIWGHRIPAWYLGDEVRVQVSSPGPKWVQDEDVLDTWFSSALWPLVTLGWPDDKKDFEMFYPTNVLVTGYDIIFFWVARMIFQGLEFTNQDPFKDVLLHGLIRDKDGVKMSKSLGNGVDPMEVIENYGTDALRYFLATNSAPGADLRFETEKIESSWNFINKLWNITRFIAMNITDKAVEPNFDNLTLVDQWILTNLTKAIEIADYNYEKYEFGEASRALYNFIWNDFADVYVEFAKVSLQDEKKNQNTQAILLYVLKASLKAVHPFIPFVTEKLYQEISFEESIVISKWPTPNHIYQEASTNFEEINEIIYRIRNLRSENDVAPSKKLNITLIANSKKWQEVLVKESVYLEKFLNTSSLKIVLQSTEQKETIILTTKETTIIVDKDDIIDIEREKEILLGQLSKLEAELSRSKAMLSNDNFIRKAPESKVKEEQDKLDDYQRQFDLIKERLKGYV